MSYTPQNSTLYSTRKPTIVAGTDVLHLPDTGASLSIEYSRRVVSKAIPGKAGRILVSSERDVATFTYDTGIRQDLYSTSEAVRDFHDQLMTVLDGGLDNTFKFYLHYDEGGSDNLWFNDCVCESNTLLDASTFGQPFGWPEGTALSNIVIPITALDPYEQRGTVTNTSVIEVASSLVVGGVTSDSGTAILAVADKNGIIQWMVTDRGDVIHNGVVRSGSASEFAPYTSMIQSLGYEVPS